ncbi:MAG TPA: rhodanese-like domain-containing protein [Fimbriimonadales bacterium]|jgi:rhodanese-related sulfurtransferase|nr:rhodanese-like domain-containing protein [Fimbriimonadales bacterium]
MNANDLRITMEELQQRLDSGEIVQFIDCRNDTDWSASDEKIPGAIRVRADDAANYAHSLPEGLIVAYCT